MEVSALTYPAALGRHGRSPLARLHSDEHLIKLIRAGHDAAFEALLSRYESRLLAFCRHMLGSREDAEDVLQEVFAAAYNAIHADDREINVRPWLYRIARNRSLNHMRRAQAIGVDSMDVLFAAHGETTAEKVQVREEFRLLVDDIHGLPESQRTALILRELDALTYEQIAEAMETTVSSVKSLLVRARVSLAEASEARLLTCGEVRSELGELAEGLIKRPNPLVRRHLKSCDRCVAFNKQLKRTSRALSGLVPTGPVAIWRTGLLSHLSGQAGGGAASIGSSAAGAGAGGLAVKAAAGLALTAIITAAGLSSGGDTHLPALAAQPTSATAAPARSVDPSRSATINRHPGAAGGTSARPAPTRTITAAALQPRALHATGGQEVRYPISASRSTAGLTTPADTGSSAAQTTPGSSAATANSTTATSGASTSLGSLLDGGSGTNGTDAGALSSATNRLETVAGTLGAGLGGAGTGGTGGAGSGSGSGGSGSSSSSSGPTLTIPILTPASGSGSASGAAGSGSGAVGQDLSSALSRTGAALAPGAPVAPGAPASL